MSDENDNGLDKKSESGGRAPLSLKPRLSSNVASGTVKQSFSHGRSKTVVVETKRRVGTPPPAGAPAVAPRPAMDTNLAPRPRPAAPQPQAVPSQRSNTASGNLSHDELEKRRLVIEQAKVDQEKRATEARLRAEKQKAQEALTPPPEVATVITQAAPDTPVESPKPSEPVAEVKPAPVVAPQTQIEAKPDHRPSGTLRSNVVVPTTRAPMRDTARPAPTRSGEARPSSPHRSDARPGDRPPRSDQRPDSRQDNRSGPRPSAPRAPGETVRYSANSPRPPRSVGAALPTIAAPTTPDVTRIRSNRGEAPVRTNAERFTEDEDAGRKKGAANLKAVSRTRGEPKRREGRLTIQAVVGDDEDAAERMRSLASVRRAREREREKRKGSTVDQTRAAREVIIPDVITVQELSNRMAVRAVDIIKMLMKQGMMLKLTDVIDTDTAELVASEFGHTVRRVSESDVEEGFIAADDHEDDTVVRPPVVAVMGHVDHGKTSLLDALRKTGVAQGEAGGITQHIGAYQVKTNDGERITFLDTPGHAAFSALRARGANVTDIVVLVVAADDGVMPQTIEAINHARAAKTPLIVAINKIDKPDAKPQNIINELLQHEIVVESLGGDTQVIEVSAKTGQGLDNLIEAIALQAEVLELRANPDRSAEGVVIEAKLDKGRGSVATVIVKRGTLKRGDIIVAGSSWGRVRALINERDEQLLEAGPSEPVEILGLDEAPDPGDAFAVVENEARAREITDYRDRKRRDKIIAPIGAVSLSDMMSKLATNKLKELQLIIKADVQGSCEAIVSSLEKLSTDEVRARIIHSGAGAITESDVQLAKGSNAPIIGFNVRAGKQARELADREGVEIRYYAIIYDLIDDIKGVLSGMLSPIQRETFLGNAEVLEVFDISKVGKVAGCRVTEGRVQKGARVRILRDNVVIQEMGVLSTLKRFKDEVNEVQVSQECGMSFGPFQDIKAGDLIECFTVEEIKRTL